MSKIAPRLTGKPSKENREKELQIAEVAYKSGEGEVKGRIYRPKTISKLAPALVVLPGRGRDFRGMDWLVKPLAERGYVVLAIGYRGLPARYYLEDVEDALNAISYLEALSYVDRTRIGIYGHSRGGMAALMAAASGDTRIRSIAAASASTDHFKNLEEKKGSAVHFPDRMRTRGKPPEEDPEYYRAISPIYNAHKMADVPILLVHGARDFLTFVDHSLNMYGALKVAGNRSARLEIIIGAGHFFERGSSGYAFDEVVEVVSTWFDKTMLNNRSVSSETRSKSGSA
jgi:dipeptidyl aminopeptidase/acylaminoacyl peptidase